MPAAVIFDLDGTLIDSAPDIGQALNRLLAERRRDAVTAVQVRQFIGDGARRLVERGFAATGAALSAAEAGPAVARFLELYADCPADPACLYPGVAETLERLAGAGHPLGLCTNKPAAATRRILVQVGLAPVFGAALGAAFDAVVGGDSLPQRKPAAEPLLAVIHRLGRPAGGAVMVGDGPNDVAAARAAGVPAVAVSYGYSRGDPADLSADLLIDRFTDLPAALDVLARRHARNSAWPASG